ncbi:hypothetical protein ACSBL2_05525 [Pedobacter sp. AW31-3R]|uniref:hypothetical protein n=1 Tax=Pedobacter sp. AW31-3R TaxID=3445781 RepID=UPI003F9EE009
MGTEEIITLLTSIEQQVSSSILGGMEENYIELANQGYIIIHEDDAHPSATITQKGIEFLETH